MAGFGKQTCARFVTILDITHSRICLGAKELLIGALTASARTLGQVVLRVFSPLLGSNSLTRDLHQEQWGGGQFPQIMRPGLPADYASSLSMAPSGTFLHMILGISSYSFRAGMWENVEEE